MSSAGAGKGKARLIARLRCARAAQTRGAQRPTRPFGAALARFWDAGKRRIGAVLTIPAQNKGGKKLKDLQAEKGVAPAADAPAAEPAADAPAAAEEEEAKEEPGTPPLEEAPPAAKAEEEEAPKAKEPEAKAPPPEVRKEEHKEEAKPAAAEATSQKDDEKKPEHSHNDGELMHQHPKDCFLTLWPGILSVRGPGDALRSGQAEAARYRCPGPSPACARCGCDWRRCDAARGAHRGAAGGRAALAVQGAPWRLARGADAAAARCLVFSRSLSRRRTTRRTTRRRRSRRTAPRPPPRPSRGAEAGSARSGCSGASWPGHQAAPAWAAPCQHTHVV